MPQGDDTMSIDLANMPLTSISTTERTRLRTDGGIGRGTDQGTDGGPGDGPDSVTIPVGVRVELLNRFEQNWVRGFSIASCGDGEFQLRRLSDGHVLPAWFPAASVRPILES